MYIVKNDFFQNFRIGYISSGVSCISRKMFIHYLCVIKNYLKIVNKFQPMNRKHKVRTSQS